MKKLPLKAQGIKSRPFFVTRFTYLFNSAPMAGVPVFVTAEAKNHQERTQQQYF
jgi:hypothetical protein